MRVLVVTKIFPNSIEPLSSPFNRQQFDALARQADVQLLATIPWFPGAAWFGRWSAAGRLASVPARERIGLLEVEHPRFLFVPRIGHALSGPLYAASLARRVLAERGSIDVIVGSWAYPDGYAAVQLGRLLGVPAVVKLHGSDMNVVARMSGPRRRLASALPRAARVVAVSRSLARRAAELGVAGDRIDVVRNGVDTSVFHLRDRARERERLGLARDARILVYVGRIEREKGVLDLLDAFERVRLPDARLLMVGDGSAMAECRRRAQAAGGRVELLGAQPLGSVAELVAAADVVTLPSWNEGMPNVVLEALASGRRVVASNVGGIPELVDDPALGELVPPRAPELLAAALERSLARPYDPAEVVDRSGITSWEESARKLLAALRQASGCAQQERNAA